MDIQSYLNNIREVAKNPQATEHSYRPALAGLFTSINDKLTVINEPKRFADVGAVDFVFNDQHGVGIGWCEAKDLFKDISKFKTGDYSKEQKERYKKGFPNLIYTNGTDFEFIREGEVTGFVSIADLIPTLPPRPDEFPRLEMLLKDFLAQTPISINSAKQLAKMMAGKAVIIKDIMGNALVADTADGIETELTGQYEGFKKSLIHDITIADFADVYAETIAYGLFAARLHDDTLGTFNRAEALELLPKSNPFLRNLFVYIAGNNLDDRLRRMIDDLCDVFRACDVGALMQDFGKFTARNDPFLHFYETFLAQYNPAKRKARGVWYTPEPVVNFIVRAVDEVLKTEFNLPRGIADTSKIQIDWDTGQNDPKTGKPLTIKKDVHRVQILDPATGTGTFLAEAIKQIAAQVKDIAPGMWSGYVEENLIPRLHGFELLMASYAMCHMKLDMMLTDMGYKPSSTPPRLGVYLTNSLEEGERVEQTLPFARWLSEEAKGANTIKRDTPIMCVIGNPPYSGHSSNKGLWIESLMSDYKVSPELKRPAQAKWLSDDYVKFIRFSEHMIEKNREGILGFITNHGYLDNPTFMDMRRHLMDTFDLIHVFVLHGNAKKKEVSPDGTPDKNVFDIQQGVAIIVATKSKASPNSGNAKVFHREIWGSRDAKYANLWASILGDNHVQEVTPQFSPWRFTPTGGALEEKYQLGFSLSDLLSLNGRPAPGFATQHDEFAISFSKHESVQKVEAFLRAEDEPSARGLFSLCAQNQWQYARAKTQLSDGVWRNELTRLAYRPLDQRWTVFNRNVAVHRRKRVMAHLFNHYNVAFCLSGNSESIGSPTFDAVSIVNQVTELNYFRRGGAYVFPLYLYPEEGTLETERRVNFDPKIYAEIKERAGLNSSPERGGGPSQTVEGAGLSSTVPDLGPPPSVAAQLPPPHSGEDYPDELRVFDYIYGVLHSRDYRATYAQFLKIDFPRIPYPASPEVFAHIAEKGGQLRRLHLMEDAAIGATPYPFSGDGDNVVVKPAYSKPPRDGEGDHEVVEGYPSVTPPLRSGAPPPRNGEVLGRVHINPEQYFEGVPQLAWEFHIGGYQPAQKWLKDRKGRALSFDDVLHYQKIIKILIETDRIMKEIKLPL